ncbi:hypothetical protein GLOTRDRAFT_133204 [Gloeophyllum trabeum ATCC 11539]|uniref:HTH cro/C1-type domain-containing protein n=1 Tax=Gloeophyllum trabeum (strain ATCC 11539 / FP-39264 / Madison 617) TaxID=670483 RepID=S7RFP2_GLOTA|nr:uncharacterized protein GLOTRDRAFT_133204 [Gloeophyllum trabeum ATCC 11539]EPQ51334.1 hypothetical protein GLOTRDRAFT_133204 [Gloeophyllum trabeum ATCC 11539]
MAVQTPCPAIKAAQQKKGLSYGEIASKMGQSEKHVEDICSGTEVPTKQEFDQLGKTLDIMPPPNDKVHKTK